MDIICTDGEFQSKTEGYVNWGTFSAPTVVSIAAYDQWEETIGTGTGFFVDDQGTFVTNWHVLEDAMRLRVELSTGERFDNVYLVTDDKQRDIALLRIPAERTPAATLGVDQDLEVGDPVYVMGNPLGLDRTSATGWSALAA
jgi:serine protease Do